MFSKEYFNYLVKSKKFLLIFVLLISVLTALNKYNELSIIMQGFICVLLTYIIPCNVFYHVHDKKAVDTFFSIPISRLSILVTGIIFSVLSTYIPFVIGFTFYAVSQSIGVVAFVLTLLKILVVAFVLVMFNTALYLIGNNVVDGIIMIGAYTFMPLSLLIALSVFGDSYVAGSSLNTTFVSYLSPIFLSTDLFFDIFNQSIVNVLNIPALLVYICISAYLLYRFYVLRDVERASSPSDKAYSYPLVIYIYVLLMLFIISSNYNYYYKNVSSFVNDFFLIYLMLFIVYVGAHFVYKRKFYLSYKLPVLYILALVITLSFCIFAKNTRGFGLANKYDKNDLTGQYILYSWDENSDDKISKAIKELGYNQKISYISIQVTLGDSKHNKEISKTSLDIIEKYRQLGIETFYNQKHAVNTDLNITSSDNQYYHYRVEGTISYDDLLVLAKDKTADILIMTDFGEFELLEDGSLKVSAIYVNE